MIRIYNLSKLAINQPYVFKGEFKAITFYDPDADNSLDEFFK
jgi:hypothetical protein